MERLKDALMRTLREEYGITNARQLDDAIRSMDKLDISQFVVPLPKKCCDRISLCQ